MMKKLALLMAVAVLLATATFPLTIAEAFTPKAGYTVVKKQTEANTQFYAFKNIGGDTLKVQSVKGYRASNGIIFKLHIVSPDARDFSVFNPPVGDEYMKIYSGQIKKGSNELRIEIPEKKLNALVEAKDLTMKFGFDDSKHSYLYMKTAVFSKFEKTTELVDDTVKLGYSTSIGNKEGLVVNDISAERIGDQFYFYFDVKSPEARSLQFFNPPDGDMFKLRFDNVFAAGENKIAVEMEVKDVEEMLKYPEITISLFGSKKSSFVFLDLDSLKDLLEANE